MRWFLRFYAAVAVALERVSPHDRIQSKRLRGLRQFCVRELRPIWLLLHALCKLREQFSGHFIHPLGHVRGYRVCLSRSRSRRVSARASPCCQGHAVRDPFRNLCSCLPRSHCLAGLGSIMSPSHNSKRPLQAAPGLVACRVRANPSVKGTCLRQAPYVER